MGLFDKKKKGRDEFDSPVEHVDLRAPAADPSPAASDGAAADREEPETVDYAAVPPALRAASPAAAPVAPQATARPARPAAYGIDDAIALMRTLPSENIELVVQVVKHTLESAHIDIRAIIQDAAAKQESTEARMQVLRDAVAELQREIDARRAEIGRLEAEHRETTQVKERLILAERLAQGGRADTVVDSHAPDHVPAARMPERGRASMPPPAPGSASRQTPVAGSAVLASAAQPPSGSQVGTPVGPGGPVGGAGSYAVRSGPGEGVSKK